MVTSTTISTQPSVVDHCDDVIRLIHTGKEAEAKKLFPVEYYLVKKYGSLGLAEFKKLMANRIQLL